MCWSQKETWRLLQANTFSLTLGLRLALFFCFIHEISTKTSNNMPKVAHWKLKPQTHLCLQGLACYTMWSDISFKGDFISKSAPLGSENGNPPQGTACLNRAAQASFPLRHVEPPERTCAFSSPNRQLGFEYLPSVIFPLSRVMETGCIFLKAFPSTKAKNQKVINYRMQTRQKWSSLWSIIFWAYGVTVILKTPVDPGSASPHPRDGAVFSLGALPPCWTLFMLTKKLEKKQLH